MEKRLLYSNGLPWDGPLDYVLDEQIDRVNRKKKASCIIVDGIPGNGKTTLLVHIIDRINKKFGLGPCSLDLHDHPQLSMGGKQFVEYLRIGRKNELIILGYDEAGDFDKRDFRSRFNKTLNNIFQRYRGFRIILILALPNFNVLDGRLFDYGVPRVLIHCHSKGESYSEYSCYSLVAMHWIRYWYDKLPRGIRYMCYSKVDPNFRGHFLDLEPARSKELDKLSTLSKDSLTVEAEIEMEGLLPYSTIAQRLNRSVNWLRITANILKLKPKKIIKRVKYFEPNVIDVLSNYLDSLQRKRD